MKEGYLQLKIAELNDKCKKIEQMLSLEESTLELLNQRVGDSKEMVKKLKNLESFKTKIIKEITEENEKLTKQYIENLSKKFSDMVETTLKNKSKGINNSLDYLQKREKNIEQLLETINDLNKQISFLLEHNNLLMMKLVNKGLISDQEVNEMHRRASKQTEKQ